MVKFNNLLSLDDEVSTSTGLGQKNDGERTMIMTQAEDFGFGTQIHKPAYFDAIVVERPFYDPKKKIAAA